MTPLETNARKLIGVVVRHFPQGGICEDLRRAFEQDTSLRRQSFYNALTHCRQRGWLVGGGGPHNQKQLYNLNPDGSWKELASSGEGTGEAVGLDKDRLEYLVDTQTQQIQGLQSEIEQLRSWGNGSDVNEIGVAIPSLVRIVSDSSSTMRQRIKAAETILNFQVKDESVVEFTKKFLQSVCTGADVATDHKVEAAGLLRRCESPRTAPETVKLSYSDDSTGATRIEAWRTYERWQLRKQIVLETCEPPKPGWDDHLQRDSYAGPPEGTAMPPVRVVEDLTSGFRLLDNLMPGFAPPRTGRGTEDAEIRTNASLALLRSRGILQVE